MTELKNAVKDFTEAVEKLKRRLFIACIITVFGIGIVIGLIIGIFITN